MPLASLRAVVRSALLLFLGAFLLSACESSAAPAARPTPAPTEPSLAAVASGAYAALGASETYGTGARPHTRGYAYLVASALHARRFVDTGNPGITIDAAYQNELDRALAIRPSLATVFFGFNDVRTGVTKVSYLSDLHDLVATLRRAGTRVIIIGLPDISHLPAVRRTGIGGVHQLIVSWNAGQARVARQTGAVFLNLGQFNAEIAANPRYISADGLHPSNLGYARLAKVIVRFIRVHHLWES